MIAGQLSKSIFKSDFFQFVFLGISTSLITGILLADSTVSQIQFPLAFMMISIVLAIFIIIKKKSTTSKEKILFIYTYGILGLAYSFFFYLIFNKAILEGKTLKGNSGLINFLISIAIAAFVYIFTITFLFRGRRNKLVNILIYISFIFIPFLLYSFVKDVQGGYNYLMITLTCFIHFLFVAMLITYILNVMQFMNLINHTVNHGKILLIFFATLFNYLIVTAIISVIIYLLNEHVKTKEGIVQKSQKHTALLLAVASLFIHLIFMATYADSLIFVSTSLVKNNFSIATGIVWSFYSLFVIVPLA